MGIDTSAPTANGKQYPMDAFMTALQADDIQKMLKMNSLYGEVEHPRIAKGTDEVTNLENMSRILYKDANSRTHLITGYEVEGAKIYFRVRTSIENKMMVNDILNGRIPSFSIRTICQFVPENGVMVARTIKFVTLDYVDNPASEGDPVAQPDIQKVDVAGGKIIDLKLMQKASGFESVETDFGITQNEEIVDVGIENVLVVREKKSVVKKSVKSVHDLLEKELRYSILD